MGAGRGGTRRLQGVARQRLSKAHEFQRVYAQRRSAANKYVVVCAADRADGSRGARLGLSVSTKVGKAVQRSRVKRVLREAFWAVAVDLGDRDYIIVARPGVVEWVAETEQTGISQELLRLGQRRRHG